MSHDTLQSLRADRTNEAQHNAPLRIDEIQIGLSALGFVAFGYGTMPVKHDRILELRSEDAGYQTTHEPWHHGEIGNAINANALLVAIVQRANPGLKLPRARRVGKEHHTHRLARKS